MTSTRRPLRLLATWPGSVGLALLAHAAVANLTVRSGDDREPLQTVDFQLADLPEPAPPPPPPPPDEPEPPPPPPPPPPSAPAGERNPDPKAAPERTSLQSNRADDDTPDEDVPIVTGLALDADQLVEGGMGVRVGNTTTPGFDPPEPVAVEDLRGFQGGGAGGGGLQGAAAGISEPPRLLRGFKPEYPVEARRDAVEGTVVLLVEILPNGRAGEIELLRGVHPVLDRESLLAARRCRWRPARADGQKVATWQRLRFTWQLEEPD